MRLPSQLGLLDTSIVTQPPHARLPRLDLGIDWGSRWGDFRTSLRAALTGPRPEGNEAISGGADLRVEWIQSRRPNAALFTAMACHAAAIWLATLPIWGFLPKPEHTLAPVQIETTWYVPEDLQPIKLPARAKNNSPQKAAAEKSADENASPQPVADAYHPTQTILSVPVRMTHPRQTLIRPDAPQDAPKLLQPLPNMVEWAATQPKLQVPVSFNSSTPDARRVVQRDTTAPDITRASENHGPLDIAQPKDPRLSVQIPIAPMSQATQRTRNIKEAAAPEMENPKDSANALNIAQPQAPRLTMQMPASATATATARNRNAQREAAAPEIGSPSAGNPDDMKRLVALSASPAPPAPAVRVPEGNLAAPISISPNGKNSGPSSGTPGIATTVSGKADGTASAENLPAAISVSGNAGNRAASPGVALPENLSPNLALKPMISSASGPSIRTGPADAATLAPGAAPEKLLSGQVYTVHVNAPNMISSTGSWILSFAQLGIDSRPAFQPKGELSGPLPIRTADPKYPPETIEEHIQGEVVLYAIIRKNGSVDSIQVVHSLDPRLDKAAADALAKWEFQPGMRAGTPVDLEAVIHVPFEYKHVR